MTHFTLDYFHLINVIHSWFSYLMTYVLHTQQLTPHKWATQRDKKKTGGCWLKCQLNCVDCLSLSVNLLSHSLICSFVARMNWMHIFCHLHYDLLKINQFFSSFQPSKCNDYGWLYCIAWSCVVHKICCSRSIRSIYINQQVMCL